MRIQFGMSVTQIINNLSEGNPGAVKALSRIYHEGHKVDPDSDILGPFFTLDTFGIYGDKINILYMNICNGSMVHTLAVCRGLQLGLLSKQEVLEAINGKYYSKFHPFSVEFFDLITKIKELIPNFNK